MIDALFNFLWTYEPTPDKDDAAYRWAVAMATLLMYCDEDKRYLDRLRDVPPRSEESLSESFERAPRALYLLATVIPVIDPRVPTGVHLCHALKLAAKSFRLSLDLTRRVLDLVRKDREKFAGRPADDRRRTFSSDQQR